MNDSDLAGVRELDEIARLPEAGRAARRRLWEKADARGKRGRAGPCMIPILTAISCILVCRSKWSFPKGSLVAKLEFTDVALR
jgi:hypothetical protein